MTRWLPAPGFEDKYEVSDAGDVRNTSSEKILSPYSLPSGHRVAGLWRNNKTTKKYVHRLVLEAFGNPCPQGMECLHINGDPSDNRIENLRWGSRSENMMDEVVAGRHWQTKKTRCKQGHEFTPENTLIRGRKRTQRVCRTCNEEWQAEYRERKKAQRPE